MAEAGRSGEIHRITGESDVHVWLDLDGTGASEISTGVGFYDHMLTALSKHSLIDLRITTTGDVHVDGHHSVEDTAIAIGQALRVALGDKRGIRRFGDALVPLDEALAQCVVDVAGRPYVVCSGEPEGQVYAEFQSYCKALKSIGVILAVDSKNDEANALAGLNHPDGVLRPDDFVAIKANWDPKDLNLKAIASELNLGADSFVFADDNPAERAIVAAQVPGVAVPALDGAENYIKTLDHGGYFEVTALSKEDLKKTELYHQNAERAKAQAAFADYGQYLDSLEMTATIKGFEPLYIQRIAQLTNKSNQFNLTTLRCSEDDIRAMAGDKNDLCLCGKLVDKFGDNGIVTVVAGRQQGDVLDLTLWLMSCRVLKRGMEDAMMDTVVAEAAARGVKTIVGHYYPTAKNAMVREFYAQYDFAKTAEDADGNTEWTLDVAAYTPKHPHMKIER